MNTKRFNPLSIACPICLAEKGKDCRGLPPGWQHAPRALPPENQPRKP